MMNSCVVCCSSLCCKKGFDMQYPHPFKKMVGCNTLIMLTLNLLIFFLNFFVDSVLNPDLAPQEVPPPMQDAHVDAMKENGWVHEGSKRCCKVMQLGRYGHPSTHPRRLRQQDHTSMNVCILNNMHARQKWNEKKAFD
jgi:hypothetical protein